MKYLVLALFTSLIFTSHALALCIVSDPNPPLNVRMSPNGEKLKFQLQNGEQVEIIDTKISHGRIWIYVADASPLGWVLKDLIQCRYNGD